MPLSTSLRSNPPRASPKTQPHRRCKRSKRNLFIRLLLYILSTLIFIVCWAHLSALPRQLHGLGESARNLRSGVGEGGNRLQSNERGGLSDLPPTTKIPSVRDNDGGGGSDRLPTTQWWSNLQECKYEGNCPRGTTCVWNPQHSSQGGFCEPYLPEASELLRNLRRAAAATGDADDPSLEKCAVACKQDVEIDEQVYFKVKPVFNSTVRALPSRGRPGGCVVLFERQWKAFKDDLPVTDWRSKRREAIVRLDSLPVSEFNPIKGHTWAALCYDPCSNNNMCHPPNAKTIPTKYSEKPPFTCQDTTHTCQRQRRWIPPNPDGYNDLVVITGANSGYFRGLTNAVASLKYWAPKNKVVVYNLGMKPDEVARAKNWSNVVAVEWEDGIPAHYPKHIHAPRMYAWKPTVINESLHKYNMIFWSDAGSTITGPLDPLEKIIEQTGAFLVWGQDLDMTRMSRHATYEYLNSSKDDYAGRPHFAGGIQGHILPSPYVDTIVHPNAACSMIRECIGSPPRRDGEANAGHRFDQTTLSILAHQPDVMPRHHTELLAAEKKQLNTNLNEPSKKIIWTARQSCRHYAQLMGL